MGKRVFGSAADEALLVQEHAQPARSNAHPGLLREIGAQQRPEVQTSNGSPNDRGAVSAAASTRPDTPHRLSRAVPWRGASAKAAMPPSWNAASQRRTVSGRRPLHRAIAATSWRNAAALTISNRSRTRAAAGRGGATPPPRSRPLRGGDLQHRYGGRAHGNLTSARTVPEVCQTFQQVLSTTATLVANGPMSEVFRPPELCKSVQWTSRLPGFALRRS